MRKAKSAEIWKFRGGLTEEKNARESRRSAGAFAHDHTPMATHQDERRRKTNREGGKALCAIEARGENDQTRLGRLPGVSLAVGRANVAGVKYQGRQEEGRGPAPTRNGRGPRAGPNKPRHTPQPPCTAAMASAGVGGGRRPPGGCQQTATAVPMLPRVDHLGGFAVGTQMRGISLFPLVP